VPSTHEANPTVERNWNFRLSSWRLPIRYRYVSGMAKGRLVLSRTCLSMLSCVLLSLLRGVTGHSSTSFVWLAESPSAASSVHLECAENLRKIGEEGIVVGDKRC